MIFKDVALQIPKPYLNTTLSECGQTRKKYEKTKGRWLEGHYIYQLNVQQCTLMKNQILQTRSRITDQVLRVKFPL